MNNKKRVITSMLCMALVLSFLAGCGGDKKPVSESSNTSSVSENANIDETSSEENVSGNIESAESNASAADTSNPTQTSGSTQKPSASSSAANNNTDPTKNVDLKGATIIVATNDKEIFGTKKGTKRQNAIAERTSLLKSKLNCEIKVDYRADAEALYQSAFTTISSGKKFANVIIPNTYKVCAYLSSNMLAPLNNIPGLDLNKSYWQSAVTGIAKYNNNVYFAANPANEHLSISTVMFFNKKLAKAINWDPYADVKANKWNFSKLKTVVKQATVDLDGKAGMSTADQWGLAQTDPGTRGMMALVTGASLEMIKGTNGKYTYNMDDKNIINTVNFGKALFVDDKVNYRGKSDSDMVNLFTSGHALLLSSPLSDVEKITNMEDDFGLIPFPHSDSANKYVSNIDWNARVIMVPRNIKGQELENTGKFLEAFAYLAQDTSKAIKKEYEDRHFRDDESGEMLSLIESNLKLDAAQIFGGSSFWSIHEGTFRVFYSAIDENKNPQSVVDANKNAAIEELKKQLAKIK